MKPNRLLMEVVLSAFIITIVVVMVLKPVNNAIGKANESNCVITVH